MPYLRVYKIIGPRFISDRSWAELFFLHVPSLPYTADRFNLYSRASFEPLLLIGDIWMKGLVSAKSDS